MPPRPPCLPLACSPASPPACSAHTHTHTNQSNEWIGNMPEGRANHTRGRGLLCTRTSVTIVSLFWCAGQAE
eukprot:3854045-Pyramimonas_sp.AAC.2